MLFQCDYLVVLILKGIASLLQLLPQAFILGVALLHADELYPQGLELTVKYFLLLDLSAVLPLQGRDVLSQGQSFPAVHYLI